MNKLTKLVLCSLLPLILDKVADVLEGEVKETKTKWDDLAIVGLRQLASFLPIACRELEANK